MQHTFAFKTIRAMLFATIVVAGLAGSGMTAARAQGVPGSVLVRIQPGVDIRDVAAAYGATVQDGVPNRGLYSLAPRPGVSETALAKQISGDPRAVYAEQNTFIDSPEVRGEPFHFAVDKGPNPGGYVNQGAYKQINIGKALFYTTGSGVIVAVLDTGATFTHPALRGRYRWGYNAINPNTLPTDVPDGVDNLAVGHGTMIAGLITRVAPNAVIMPVRVLNGDGIGTMLDVAKGVDYAVTHGAQVINMSFGAPAVSSVLNDVLDQAETAGIVLVASAGNDNLNQPQIPAVGRGTLAVASVESNNTKSSYSNYGSFVRVDAPGSGIRSTFWDGGYATWSGTSFAAPLVAAEAALLLSEHPGMTSDGVVTLIRKTAHTVDNTNPSYRGNLGSGVIDIEAAVLSTHF
jgi:thermitase